MSSLRIEQVGYAFGETPVLADVSFTVAPGELVCLVGPSGCGKSTLLRLIAGLAELPHGSIHLNGHTLATPDRHVPPQQRRIGLVFQHPSLFPHLSVRDNIAFGLRHRPRAERDAAIARMLRLVGLAHKAVAFPHMLSGGQHQRVALARALAPEPHAMLLDEPFANLDNQLRRELREEVTDLLSEAGIPVIMVTHDPEEALIMADRMVLLSESGTIRQIGTPEAIHNHPVDVQAAAFFGVINRIPGHIEGDRITSSLGELPTAEYAPHLPDGTAVEIVTRPEGLRIPRQGNVCVNARVIRARHTGAGWLITAALEAKTDGAADEGLTVRFHHIYGECPGIGERVCIAYEPPHIFVFARDAE